MAHNYHTCGTTAANMIAELDERSALHCAHIASIFDVCRRGDDYSFEHSDVIASALHDLGRAFDQVPDHRKGWVEFRGAQRAHIAEAKRWAFETIRAEG